MGFEQKEEEVKFLLFFCLVLFVVGDVCNSVLDTLQYLVGLEGRMLEGVDGCISEG
jgi:hypothetical protein